MDQQIEIQIKCLSPKKTLVLLRCFWKKWRIANNSIIRTVVWRKRLATAEVTSDTRTRFELHQSRYHYNFQNTNFSDNILKKKKIYGFSIWTIWVESEKWPFIKTIQNLTRKNPSEPRTSWQDQIATPSSDLDQPYTTPFSFFFDKKS